MRKVILMEIGMTWRVISGEMPKAGNRAGKTRSCGQCGDNSSEQGAHTSAWRGVTTTLRFALSLVLVLLGLNHDSSYQGGMAQRQRV